jgi:hypothetical protein
MVDGHGRAKRLYAILLEVGLDLAYCLPDRLAALLLRADDGLHQERARM